MCVKGVSLFPLLPVMVIATTLSMRKLIAISRSAIDWNMLPVSNSWQSAEEEVKGDGEGGRAHGPSDARALVPVVAPPAALQCRADP